MQTCDVIVLTWNRLDLLKPCVERIMAHTQVPIRLLIVDNGSTEAEAIAYMDRLQPTTRTDILMIRQPTNRAISVALNAGLAQSTAPWICVMNNDILVTEGWLEEMVRVAERSPEIGLVNPMSNEFNVRPQGGEDIDVVGRRCQGRRGQWIENWFAVGFCMLMPRRVLERVGNLDETFHVGYFEDTDYSLRVRQAGFITVIAEGAYVFHHGSATLQHDPDRTRRFQENEDQFFRKWHTTKPQRIAWILRHDLKGEDHEAYRRIRECANDGHKVWVFGRPSSLQQVPRHLHIVPVPIRWSWFLGGVLWRILIKKKRFQRIVTSHVTS